MHTTLIDYIKNRNSAINYNRNGYVWVISIIILVLGTTHAYGQESYSSAIFTKGKHALEKSIKFPKTKGDISVNIICDANVSISGEITWNVCFSKSQKARKYEKAIYQAIKNVRLKPASINGKHHQVRVQYSVEFNKKNQTKIIRAYQNHGHNKEIYGKNYLSAQRYTTETAKDIPYCHSKANVWVKAIISSEGIPGSIEIINGQQTEPCKEQIVLAFGKERFIPITLQGKPTASFYAESLFSDSTSLNTRHSNNKLLEKVPNNSGRMRDNRQ